jgi:rSAM/selenodomain-associated transferase 2
MISVIMPARLEGRRLLAALAALADSGNDPAARDAEIVVAAHGESPETRARAERCPQLRWVDCPQASRGEQLALGAAAARGDILWFVHADTRVPPGSATLIQAALDDPGVSGGGFRLRFDAHHPALALLERLSALPWRAAFLGDQGFFCRRQDYEAIGGFAKIPLFEDVDLAQRLARRGRLVRIGAAVTTSARRFRRRGPWRQLALNAMLWIRHYAGDDPRRAARRYEAR